MGHAAYAPAFAADVGGNCCSDLEDRVAELEATTARKGNRVVSLQIYGQVNKAILWFDADIGGSDTYIVDNDTSGSRFGFKGEGSIQPGWKAGYNIELDYQDAASDKVDNGNVLNGAGDDLSVFDDPIDEIRIRMNYVYIESERLGRITLGHQSQTTDGAAEVVLGNSISVATLYVGNSFTMVNGSATAPTFASANLADFANSLDGGRDDLVRYDSPSIYGFIASASVGENDYWDAALRYKNEWNSIRVAAAVAVASFRDNSQDDFDFFIDNNFDLGRNLNDFDNVLGSISVMHIPTGIYVAFAAGATQFNTEFENDSDADYWYVQLGLEKRFLSYGSTTFYGEYGHYSDFARGIVVGSTAVGDDVFDNVITSSDTERWGFGVVQRVDSAALELYAQATFWDISADATDPIDGGSLDLSSDLTTVLVGSRIKF
ncbi:MULTISPECIES: porin [Rhodomicrobium]|uniref:porin n=1 Tax=Rhodomicrobium TaxID=1068 RepID=UPI0014831C59|nr:MULTISPECIES: porin [Rhodomicrobium]